MRLCPHCSNENHLLMLFIYDVYKHTYIYSTFLVVEKLLSIRSMANYLFFSLYNFLSLSILLPHVVLSKQ